MNHREYFMFYVMFYVMLCYVMCKASEDVTNSFSLL